MSIQGLAGVLLGLHVASGVFIFLVLVRQWSLLKLPISPLLRKFRLTLFILSITIFLGNLIPILIDTLTLFVEVGRPATVKPISIAYAFSNGLVALLASYLIWSLYRLAASTKVISDQETIIASER